MNVQKKNEKMCLCSCNTGWCPCVLCERARACAEGGGAGDLQRTKDSRQVGKREVSVSALGVGRRHKHKRNNIYVYVYTVKNQQKTNKQKQRGVRLCARNSSPHSQFRDTNTQSRLNKTRTKPKVTVLVNASDKHAGALFFFFPTPHPFIHSRFFFSRTAFQSLCRLTKRKEKIKTRKRTSKRNKRNNNNKGWHIHQSLCHTSLYRWMDILEVLVRSSALGWKEQKRKGERDQKTDTLTFDLSLRLAPLT